LASGGLTPFRTTKSLPALDDSRVIAALEEYLSAAEAGRRPDRDDFLTRHADIADPLAACIDGMEVLHGLEPGSESSGANVHAAPLGDFRILREVGRGGMGVVYEAEQMSLGRRVALKVLPFAATMDPRHLQRFQNEARAAASLEHPHIVPVYGVGCERGVHYYAMKFIEGRSLAEVIHELKTADERNHRATENTENTEKKQNTKISSSLCSLCSLWLCRSPEFYKSVAQLGIQAAEALEHAHSLGIVHRDIKPANLMIDGQGKLWITDFGLARTAADAGLTMTGDVLGTLRYMSPEQALAKHGLVDHRTDVYSLGVTLYELLTGKPAVGGKDREEILNAITLDEPRPLRALDAAIPRDLETIVLKAIAKEPNERYATAREMAEDLRRFIDDRPIQAKPPTRAQKTRKWAQRHKVWVGAGILVLVITAMAATSSTVLVWKAYQAEAVQRKKADANYQLAREQKRHARQAVDDMYLQFADKWLDTQPGMDKFQLEYVTKVVRYYESIAQETGEDPEALLDKAKAYRTVGVIYWRVWHDREKEQHALREATAILEKLLQDSPDEPAYILELAKTQMFLGFAQNREEPFRRSVELLEGLVQRFPHEDEYRYSLARSLSNSCTVLDDARNEEAKRNCRRAIALLEEVIRTARSDPIHLLCLADAQATLGDAVSTEVGGVPEALGWYRKSIAVCRKLIPDRTGTLEYPADLSPFHHNNLGTYYFRAGVCLWEMGRRQEAKESFAQSLTIFRGLTANFPRTSHFWGALFRAYREQWALFWASGQKEEAVEAYRLASEAGEHLIKYLPETEREFAWFLLACPDQRYRNDRRGLELAKKLTEQDSESADSFLLFGIGRYRIGDFSAALEALQQAMKLPSKNHDRELVLVTAMTRFRLGDEEEAHKLYNKALRLLIAHRGWDRNWFQSEGLTMLSNQEQTRPKEPAYVPGILR
jgi:serine/threonine protein kinase